MSLDQNYALFTQKDPEPGLNWTHPFIIWIAELKGHMKEPLPMPENICPNYNEENGLAMINCV